MERISLPPSAGPFVDSLRSIGYSLDAAVADVADNSISAGASRIDIHADWNSGDPTLAIKDDGTGMDPEALQSAMRLGSVDSEQVRSKTDLGRFGLGLKTASFSQCKSLMVISRRALGDAWYGIRWDLSLIKRENLWIAEVIDPESCEKTMREIDFDFPIGTAVVWDQLDRVVDPTSQNAQTFFEHRIADLMRHLALTFHRFMTGEDVKKVIISINDRPIAPMDPFGVRPPMNNPASTLLSDEYLRVDKYRIRVKSYLLPHPSKLGHDFKNSISLKGDYHAGQGLYIYRAGRLILHGGWQRLVRASESNKLARVQIDFDNDSDNLWSLDVKKSRVELPSTLRDQLKRVISNVSQKSNATFTKRAKMPSLDDNPVWQRYFDRDKNVISYRIRRDHRLLKSVLGESGTPQNQKALLSLLEDSLPLELIKNDLSSADVVIGNSGENSKLQELVQLFLSANLDAELIASTLANDSNFNIAFEDAVELIQKMQS